MYTHPYMAAHLSCPTGSSSFRWVLTSFVLPVHNQGASLATIQGHALWFNFLPATSSFFVFSLLIQTLRLQHLSADAYCNHYGCSLLLGYAAFNCSPGCLISFNIFDASYLIPLVRIAWNTLISLHATIIFQQQSKRERISGSAFEITSDTMQLENVYRLSHLEAESLFEKIKYKIEQEDLTYFYSQKAVITLFDVMQKNGLATMYITKLLEIARKLMRCDGLQEPEQFDEEYWAYLDYDNSFSCDILTRKFVNTINLYNKKNFVISEMEMQSYDEQLLEYEKLIKSREKIDKDRYMIIINSIFYMFIDEYKDIEKLWKILLRISRGPGEDVAKDVLKELIENSDDELEIIRYNHLLQEIQMNEYFDMQAEEFEKSYEYE